MGFFDVFKRKKAVKKIYKTTDGIFNGREDIKKPRQVAAIDQRKDDGAVAVIKLYTQEGKSEKNILKSPVLTPAQHPSLTKNTVAGKRVIIGKKKQDGSYEAIFPREMEGTNDKLTKKELREIKKDVQGTGKNKKTHKNTMKKWHNHFGKKKTK